MLKHEKTIAIVIIDKNIKPAVEFLVLGSKARRSSQLN